MNGMFYRGEVYYVLPDGNDVKKAAAQRAARYHRQQ